MSLPSIDVELSEAPAERWAALAPFAGAMRELAAFYVRDLGPLAAERDLLEGYRDACIDAEYQEEIRSVAALADVDPLEMVLVNAYYDAVKHVLGCTAFAVDMPDGPLHARNLDWWTEKDSLSRHSLRVRYLDRGRLLFESVGWPGYVGTLSGVAPGRFSVTLNAVLGGDPPGFAKPVSLVLRDLLRVATYSEAVSELEKCALTCDCLLLVVGVEPGEMCVIERTPTRAAVREPEGGAIVVTNDYKLLDASTDPAEATILQSTSCGRYDQASARCHAEPPTTADACFDILSDPRVRMDMTVQQMVMSAAQGWLQARPGR